MSTKFHTSLQVDISAYLLCDSENIPLSFLVALSGGPLQFAMWSHIELSRIVSLQTKSRIYSCLDQIHVTTNFAGLIFYLSHERGDNQNCCWQRRGYSRMNAFDPMKMVHFPCKNRGVNCSKITRLNFENTQKTPKNTENTHSTWKTPKTPKKHPKHPKKHQKHLKNTQNF